MKSMEITQSESRIISAKWRLQAALYRQSGGEAIAREWVSEADLGDVVSEFWMHAFLRNFCPDVPLEHVHPSIVPIFAKGSDSLLEGYRLEGEARGGLHSLLFSSSSLAPVAERASQHMLDAGVITAQERLRWELSAYCCDDEPPAQRPPDGIIAQEIPRPLEYVTAPIGPFWDRARFIGTTREREFPVFYTASALLDAARYAQEGSKLAQPVETGASLLGQLYSCPQTGEFFAVVHAAEPLENAEEKPYSLSFSAPTWQRIAAQKQKLRERPETRAATLLGECHGHPFVPQALEQAGESERDWKEADHTACVSQADVNWARAVFVQMPYQLSQIFGKTAAGRDVHALYGLRNGTLAQRGFAVIQKFEPEWIDNPAYTKSRCQDGSKEEDH